MRTFVMTLLLLTACAPEDDVIELQPSSDKADGEIAAKVLLVPGKAPPVLRVSCNEWVSCDMVIKVQVDNVRDFDPGAPGGGLASVSASLVGLAAEWGEGGEVHDDAATVFAVHDARGLRQCASPSCTASEPGLLRLHSSDRRQDFLVQLDDRWGGGHHPPIELTVVATWY